MDRVFGRQEEEAEEWGALRMVRGCDSNIRFEKKTRRRTCWPACQPASQSWMLIYNNGNPSLVKQQNSKTENRRYEIEEDDIVRIRTIVIF